MFRRRPGRPPVGRRPFRPPRRFPEWGWRRPPRRPPLPPFVRRQLREAHRLVDAGRYAEAATIFERLSDRAAQRGMAVRAADLALLASRARLAAGEADAAVTLLERGLRVFAREGKVVHLERVVARATTALREAGYTARAEEVERVWGSKGSSGLPSEERHGSLPARCPGCGAPLLPDEVEWHDPYTVECPYCGTLSKTTA